MPHPTDDPLIERYNRTHDQAVLAAAEAGDLFCEYVATQDEDFLDRALMRAVEANQAEAEHRYLSSLLHGDDDQPA